MTTENKSKSIIIYPELAAKLENIIAGKLDINFEEVLPALPIGTNEASRVSGGKVIN